MHLADEQLERPSVWDARTAIRPVRVPEWRGHAVLARQIEAFLPLTDEEARALAGLESRTVRYERGQHLFGSGDPHRAVHAICDGWAMRYKLLADGRRQIGRFLLLGDLAGLEGLNFAHADHAVMAVTPVTVVTVDIAALAELLASFPRLGFAFTTLQMHDQAVLFERLVSLGRRTAFERTAHLFVELWTRLTGLGLAQDRTIRVPVTQELLADCLSMTPVHMNRIMQQLRKAGLLRIEGCHPPKRVVLEDIEGLKRAAGFDSAYLHLGDVRSATAAAGAARTNGRAPLPVPAGVPDRPAPPRKH
jgi:CRP-like cAMP-binding protein